jgi:hypothetical protein
MKRRAPSRSARVIDSQPVETAQSGRPRVSDAGRKVKGRRRHFVTDTIGLLVGTERQKPSRAIANHPPRESVGAQTGRPARSASIGRASPQDRGPYHFIANQRYLRG